MTTSPRTRCAPLDGNASGTSARARARACGKEIREKAGLVSISVRKFAGHVATRVSRNSWITRRVSALHERLRRCTNQRDRSEDRPSSIGNRIIDRGSACTRATHLLAAIEKAWRAPRVLFATRVCIIQQLLPIALLYTVRHIPVD